MFIRESCSVLNKTRQDLITSFPGSGFAYQKQIATHLWTKKKKSKMFNKYKSIKHMHCHFWANLYPQYKNSRVSGVFLWVSNACTVGSNHPSSETVCKMLLFCTFISYLNEKEMKVIFFHKSLWKNLKMMCFKTSQIPSCASVEAWKSGQNHNDLNKAEY